MNDRRDPPWAWLDIPAPHQRPFADSGVWDSRTIADLAIELTAADPGFVALIDGESTMTREQLLVAAEALSAALSARGLRPGDVVAFQVPNWGEAAVINLAAAMSGLVVNPIVPIYRDHEVMQMLGDCRARAFFVASSFRGYDFATMAGRVRASLPSLEHVFTVRGEGADDYAALVAEGRHGNFRRPQVDPLGVKMVLYTSGTTGRPKGVLHSHVTLQRILRMSAAHWGIGQGEATLMPSPVTHVSGYANGLEMPLVWGTRTVLMESWNAVAALELIDRYGLIGTVAATPFLVELAAAARAAGNRLPSFRFFACGGAAVPADLIPAASAAFDNCRPFRVFGASEVPLVTFGWPDDPHLAATTDGAVVDYAVRIVDADDRDVAAGLEGEILARGPGMMMGYADQSQTAEAITPDGYFRTGDLGVLSPEGAITVTGRKKDLIIRGGENISAKEIEDVLHAHGRVREASVVAMPHDRLGEGICAYVIADGEPPSVADLARHVADSGLAKQKIPELFLFVDDFPRTASGKIRKDMLREDVKRRLGEVAD
ncbi:MULTISPECIES: AMP-binding protein [unclassified Sphingomonas]|uniref:AMP-binding protein n=1 Tax=unclassified Sphingomonas TaxID=196159 RepID=UPI0006F7B8EA|nr:MULTISPECIES: AMP-binding protein [unclassified Sphingomonas]KQX17894.1 AMP-dependent synthetase [Sphingomonas sp. Root1294]KQY70820.1 AMP-dependent synthetase [Sphingomonas sp. Root50]KRB91685.1 AMP-dependent synthetase [Sphingomonas sp. Root720]